MLIETQYNDLCAARAITIEAASRGEAFDRALAQAAIGETLRAAGWRVTGERRPQHRITILRIGGLGVVAGTGTKVFR